ncbi:restriction endonuclease subunit S, partial [Candidatus Gracilibacteria bacterium]|nr:restriction endonuclease subunit S [Candidatus Gracilibacteria bacterium]
LEGLSYKFLYYYLKFNQEIIVGKQGVGFDSISRDDILSLKILLPPLETQKQIVSQIETIEKEIEILKEENKQIPEKKKQILKKYL